MVFSNRSISIRCFWSHVKILFLAEVIAGQKSAPVCNNIVHAIFMKIDLRNLLLHFSSNHPQTFRIGSWDHLEEIGLFGIFIEAF